MAKKPASRKKKAAASSAPRRPLGRIIGRAALSFAAAICLAVGLYAVVPPPTTPYILSEGLRLGQVRRTWVPMDEIAPEAARAIVAAEDANFCLHWGFDMAELRAAIADGGARGASTLTQQTVKNLWLWQGRSWPRKALEAGMTPVAEALLSKRRIVELYLNMVEFDEGVFGVEAAAQHHFGVRAADLSLRQASLLAAVLPDPKGRSAVTPSAFVDRRARAIADGARTIDLDGRAACFQD